MPRLPQRLDNVVRSITHPVSFTLVEYGQLKNESYKAKVSVAELIRSRALLRRVKVPRQEPELDEKFHSKLKEVGRQLNAIAKKANARLKVDLALHLNIGEIHSLLDQLSETLKEINEVVSKRSSQLAIESECRQKSDPLAHTRSIRLTPDEYELLKTKASQARTSVAKFLRRAALRKTVETPPPPPLSYWKVHEELSSITNNLRQLQRAVYQEVSSGQALEFPHEAIEKALAQIRSVGLQLVDATDEEALEA